MALSMKILSIDFHTSIINTGLRKVQFYNTLMHLLCKQLSSTINQVQLFNDLAPLCNTFSNLLYWKLSLYYSKFGKSNLSMTLYTNISSNSLFLKIEDWWILYIDTQFISPVLFNTVNKTKLIHYYKHREHKIWNFTMVN